MRILIFDDEYPDGANLPGDMFAHTRVRLYARQCDVLVLRRAGHSRRLAYEGIEIRDYKDSAEALALCSVFAPDIAGVHFAEEPFISEISADLPCPLIVWVHGIEALAWHTSLYNLKLRDWLPHRLLFRDRRSRLRMRNFASLVDRSNQGAAIHFVFVSNWMLEMCEASIHRRVQHKSIIPNPIDTTRFQASPISNRLKNVLIIRSSDTMKYRPDAVAAVVKKLMADTSSGFKCRIFSKGSLLDKYFSPLEKYPSVELHRNFLSQEEIVEQHRWAGFFLCPTAQDAQGVSMCEAMASGLIVATTPITAIPEFVSDDMAILSRSSSRLADGIISVSNDPDRAGRMSESAANYVRGALDALKVVARELDLMKQYVSPRSA